MRWRGGVSVVVLWLTYAALHDITLDNGLTFRVEYSMLVVAAGWFAALGAHLLASEHRWAAAVSLALLALGVAACWDLPHHGAPPSLLNQLAWIPLLWFFGLAIWMLVARRGAPKGRGLSAG
jgi:hypothetical protein